LISYQYYHERKSRFGRVAPEREFFNTIGGFRSFADTGADGEVAPMAAIGGIAPGIARLAGSYRPEGSPWQRWRPYNLRRMFSSLLICQFPQQYALDLVRAYSSGFADRVLPGFQDIEAEADAASEAYFNSRIN
jgi:hypothetical protein